MEKCGILEVVPFGIAGSKAIRVGGKLAGRVWAAPRVGYNALVNGAEAYALGEREAAVAALIKVEWEALRAPVMKMAAEAAEAVKVECAAFRAANPELYKEAA